MTGLPMWLPLLVENHKFSLGPSIGSLYHITLAAASNNGHLTDLPAVLMMQWKMLFCQASQFV
jgi:hypothetical protein